MALDPELRSELDQLMNDHRVVLFMKGTPRAPQCGFSARVVGILDDLLEDYRTVDGGRIHARLQPTGRHRCMVLRSGRVGATVLTVETFQQFRRAVLE